MKNKLLKTAFKLGGFGALHRLSKERLTVLNYHRINDAAKPGFSGFAPNVSATVGLFADQLDYLLRRGFNFISQAELISWLDEEKELPPYAVLVTFDDGYADNYINAFPILRERGIPATIFLSTDYIGTIQPFYWDLVAYCLIHTPMTQQELPELGQRQWSNRSSRMALADEWVRRLKILPESKKLDILADVPRLLQVAVDENSFAGNHLSWDQVREMSAAGISFGGHTKSHPILTRISVEEARSEILESKQKIEEETGIVVTTMAYPNGGEGDYNDVIIRIVEGAGYKIAFSLVDGLPKYSDLHQNRFELRRIYLGSRDTLPRFAAKLNPIVQLLQG